MIEDAKSVPDDVEDEINLELLKIDPYAMTTTSESSSIAWEKKGYEAANEWILGYCTLPGNEYFCVVVPVFIQDKFYMFVLKQQLENIHYERAHFFSVIPFEKALCKACTTQAKNN